MARLRSLRPGPVGLALALCDVWRRLPPKQRKQLLGLAREHGPRLAARAVDARRRRAKRRRRQGRAHDPVLLAQMRGRIALARARAPGAADVVQRHAVGLRLLEPVPDRPPRAHVLRLLLHPDDLAQVRIARRRAPSPSRPGTGRAARSARPRPGPATPSQQLVADDVVVHLPLADDQALGALVVGAPRRRASGWNAPDARSSSDDDACLRRSSPFGVIDDERSRDRVERLPADQVEVLRRRRAVAMRMFSCAASWRKRSSRALECSGPLPS